MSNATNAADTLERLAVQYEGLIAAAQYFREVGSVEAAVDESKKKLASLQKEVVDTQAELDAIEASIEKAQVEQQAQVNAARQQADSIVYKAKDSADKLIVAAEAQAGEIGRKAKTAADTLTAAARRTLEQLKLDIATQTAALDEATAAAEDAKKTADAEQKRLDAIKAAILKLTQGG